MNNENFKIRTEIIKEVFDDSRAIKCVTSEDDRDVGDDIYPGGDIFTTEDGDFIDLEVQMVDFDEDELVKYIELAEALYEKHQKAVSIYILCPKNIDICVKECVIRSKADFVIKVARSNFDPCQIALQAIKDKIRHSGRIDGDDIFALSMLPSLCKPEERNHYLREYFRIMNRI